MTELPGKLCENYLREYIRLQNQLIIQSKQNWSKTNKLRKITRITALSKASSIISRLSQWRGRPDESKRKFLSIILVNLKLMEVFPVSARIESRYIDINSLFKMAFAVANDTRSENELHKLLNSLIDSVIWAR